jgi:hypothetical protein
VPAAYEAEAFRIPVVDPSGTLEGQIAIVPYVVARAVDQGRLKEADVAVSVATGEGMEEHSVLLRGGFNIGRVPGVPSVIGGLVSASVRMLWRAGEGQRYSGTNIARTGIADVKTIARKIGDVWVRYLLDHRAELSEGFLHYLYLQDAELSELTSLENYPALALYELARNGWQYEYRDPRRGLDAVADWESGKGPAKISTAQLYGDILELILPRIAPERRMERFGDLFVMPPAHDWRETLASCRDFISKPIRWSPFVSYVGEIAHRLHHNWTYAHLFNKKHATRLSGFSKSDLRRSVDLFDKLLTGRAEKRPIDLAEQDGILLDRLIDAAGELEISSVRGVARLDSFSRRK